MERTAKELVLEYGKELKDRKVITEGMGDWPGGPAIVTSVASPNSDIVMFVRHVDPKVMKDAEAKVMGIFSYETIRLVRRKKNDRRPDKRR
jgi:hypothetical protein